MYQSSQDERNYHHEQEQHNDENNNGKISKEEKLAAAKKRLKQFKNKNKENSTKPASNVASSAAVVVDSNDDGYPPQQQHHITSFAQLDSNSLYHHNNDESMTKLTVGTAAFNNDLNAINNNQYYHHDYNNTAAANHYIIDSNRSSPSSKTSNGMTRSQINDLDRQHHQNDFIDLLHKHTSRSVDMNSNSEINNAAANLPNYYEQKYKNDVKMYEEQLSLHLQTIGILVAEKTELQSTLQQTLKKIDKKQEEIDELSGRLKASRQKIIDLEFQLSETNDSSDKIEQITKQYEEYINNLKQQLNTNMLSNDEFKIRLNDLNEKYNDKEEESDRLSNQLHDLQGQLEMAELRISQLSLQLQHSSEKKDDVHLINAENNHVNKNTVDNSDLINNLNMKIHELARQKEELLFKLDNASKEKSNLQNDYQKYVEKMQNQIETLIDQINVMTDERERAFERIEKAERRAKEYKIENEKLIEINNQANIDSKAGLNELNHKLLMDERRQQLEGEVQYFKGQIEILLIDNNNLRGLVLERDKTISEMNKLYSQINTEKDNYEKLLEAIQSEKGALSRAMQQNKELKDQINELQEAYIKLTNINADLVDSIQTEQYKNKQLNLVLNTKNDEINSLVKFNETNRSLLSNEHVIVEENQVQNAIQKLETAISSGNETSNDGVNQINTNEWDNDDDDNNANTNYNNKNNDQNHHNSNDLAYINQQNENYNILFNEYNQLISKLNEKDLLIDHLNNELNEMRTRINIDRVALDHTNKISNETRSEEIVQLNVKINQLEAERTRLLDENLRIKAADNTNQSTNVTSNDVVKSTEVTNGEDEPQYTEKNIKLLEYKFMKVMQENVDLKEKNQQLEHIVAQLQFENDTIVDYISMYQMEREKLAQKYRIKDDIINKLNTKLQINKFSIKKLNECLHEYFNNYMKAQANTGDSSQNTQSDQNEINKGEEESLINQISEIISQINENNKDGESSGSNVSVSSGGSGGANADNTQQDENFDLSDSVKLGNIQKIQPLRSIILCSSCQGDLFNV